jgi:hypothetical protein
MKQATERAQIGQVQNQLIPYGGNRSCVARVPFDIGNPRCHSRLRPDLKKSSEVEDRTGVGSQSSSTDEHAPQ